MADETSTTEKVEVDKADLKALMEQNKNLMARMEQLESGQGEQIFDPEGTKEREVTLLYVDGQPIVGFKNRGSEERAQYVYNKRDPNNPNEMLQYVTVLVRNPDSDEPKQYELEFTELLRNADKRNHKVIERKTKPWTKNQGQVTRKKIDGYSMTETGMVVPVNIKGEIAYYTLELEDGEELEILEDYVNLA